MAAVKPSFKMLPVALFFLLQHYITFTRAQSIGVCYGMVADNLPAPADVVTLYKNNGITRLRLFDPNPDALNALNGSGIAVTVGVKNEDIETIAGSQAAADNWVTANISPYASSVTIEHITVGNEVIPGPSSQSVLPAMQNLVNSLSTGSLSSIGVSTVVPMNVLGASYPPSQGAFSDDTASVMSSIIAFLSSRGTPLFANVYPYFSYTGNPSQISLPYALFTAPGPVFSDGNLSYQNLFDAMVDALYSAMEKAGGSNVVIAVSESGWPSAGSDAATISNAQTYVNNFIAHVVSSNGTPKRPGKPIEAFVFAMFNEDLKPGEATEKNFGLFYPNQQPVYPVTFHP